MIELFDSHAHLYHERFTEDKNEVLERARENGVQYILNASGDPISCYDSVALAETEDMIYAAVGIHPHEAKVFTEDTVELLRHLARKDKVVAIGEIGLDYYYDHSEREIQRDVFRKQIRIAREVGLPIIVHDRDAHEDTLTILKEENAQDVGGVFHCFSGSVQMAREILKMGFYISMAGPVTFKNSKKAPEVVGVVPEDRLLIETDCPYLSPEPKRGKRNEPGHVKYVAEKIAEIRGETFEQVAGYTTQNAKRLFGIND